MNFSLSRTDGAAPVTAPATKLTGGDRSDASASLTDCAIEVHFDLAGLAREWQMFEREADATVFQVYLRLSKWQHHIGEANGTRPVIVVGRDPEGEIVFIFPLAIERWRGARLLTWLGSDLSDYNAPLLAKSFATQVPSFPELWEQILRQLRSIPIGRFDVIDLTKMQPTVGTQANPFLSLPVAENANGALAASLGSSWDQFHAERRSAATRKRERRHLKHLAEYGEIRFSTVTDEPAVTQTIDLMLAQKAASFARMGVPNIFGRPGHREFLRDLGADPRARPFMHITRLDVGPVMAAASVGLAFGDCYYLVLSSYDDGEMARFGPGRAHLHQLLSYAIEHGFKRFDFTIGDEAYKRDWCDVTTRLYDHTRALTLRGWPLAVSLRAIRRVKYVIKRNERLWPIVQKLWSRLGGVRRRLSPEAE